MSVIIIHKKICLNQTPDEIALSINAYIHDLQKTRYRTVNFTIIKDGNNFNLISIASEHALNKKQVMAAVNDTITKI